MNNLGFQVSLHSVVPGPYSYNRVVSSHRVPSDLTPDLGPTTLTVRVVSRVTPRLGSVGTCLGGGFRVLETWEPPHPRHRSRDSTRGQDKGQGSEFRVGSRNETRTGDTKHTFTP